MLKIAICDDDTDCIDKYSRMLTDIARKNNQEVSITSYTSGETLLFDWANPKRQADALYLDIHMNGIDGMRTAHELRKMGCSKEIIFFTRDKQTVYSAFDIGAFHYIVKDGENSERFEWIFQHLTERLKKKKKEYITFSYGGDDRALEIDDIKYFEIKVRLITVYYGINESFEFYSTMGKLEALLCAKGFVRTHRSILVNIAYIKRLAYEQVILNDETVLPLGRSRQKKVRELLERMNSGKAK